MGVIRAFLEWLGVLNNVVLVIPTMKSLDGAKKQEKSADEIPAETVAEVPEK